MATAAPNARALTSEQALRCRHAFGRLRAGDVPAALAIARALAGEAPAAADAHQLLALCLAETGDASGAGEAFDAAVAAAPDSEAVRLNHASWLRRTGRREEALRALQGAPRTAQVLARRGLLALELGRSGEAREAFADAIALDPRSGLAHEGLAGAHRALGELEAAERAYAHATALEPGRATAWANRGAVLRLLGRSDEAIGCVERARSLGRDDPELLDMRHGMLLDAGCRAEALAGARALVAARPDFAPGQDTLARMLWEHGPTLAPADDPFSAFRAAALAQPGNRELGMRYVRLLLEARRGAEAVERVEAMRVRDPDDPALRWLAADAFDRIGERRRAARLYADAHRVLAGTSPAFLNAHARHAFRRGEPALAGDCAAQALRLAPDDQEAWAHLGTVWRLAGDPREHWLFDYERLVGVVDVEPPPGTDATTFLAALQGTLDALHRASREPVNQSVRNGSQTGGRLFGGSDPVLAGAERALRAAVDRWSASLPEVEGHPFLSRRRRSVRFAGSWSVKLRGSGHHANHVHPEGWMSSAFYVAVPGCVHGNADHAGWLQLGQPLEELGLDLPPRRLIEPRPGQLALFPSYVWHGTVPFEGDAPRLTVAFDMQPVA